jgi:hypothetical protein
MNKKVPFIDNSRQSPLWFARNDNIFAFFKYPAAGLLAIFFKKQQIFKKIYPGKGTRLVA